MSRAALSQTKRLARHYVEMVVAMFVGMGVLAIPLQLAGTSWHELAYDAPAPAFLGMATSMTVPMVAWMLCRGHGARANLEMSASMYLPTFAVIVLVWVDAIADVGTLMAIEHVAMLVAMLGVMLARPAEYARHAHRRLAAAGDGGERA